MKGRGDYILYMDRRNFTNSGMREPCHGTDHRMVRTVLRGEGALHNRRYGWGQARWPIQPNAEQSQNEGGGSLCRAQRRGNQDAVYNEVAVVWDPTGDLAAIRQARGTTEVTWGDRTVGQAGTSEVPEIFAGRQTEMGDRRGRGY